MFTKENGIISYNSLEALVGFEIDPKKHALFNLQWRVRSDSDTDWYEAKDWVASLGESWRMPTRSELQELYNAGVKCDSWKEFENSGHRVWSGEVRNSSSAWYFNFNSGFEDWSYHDHTYYSRAFAVRNINKNKSVSSGAISLERRKHERKNS